MHIHYLEIVTADVDAVCNTYAQVHNVQFGDAVEALGGARTAGCADKGMIGVRAPMHDAEDPITRSYTRVVDIEAAVAKAAKAGAEVALPPMELPGYGKCAILIQGGVQMGLWQV